MEMNKNDKQGEKSKLEYVRELKIRLNEYNDLLKEIEKVTKYLNENIQFVDKGLSSKSNFIIHLTLTVTKNIAIMIIGAIILNFIAPSIAPTTLFILRILFIFVTSYKLNKEANKVVDNHHKNVVNLTNLKEYLSLSELFLKNDKVKIISIINEYNNEIDNIYKDSSNENRYQINESKKANILEDENNLTLEDFKKPYVKK